MSYKAEKIDSFTVFNCNHLEKMPFDIVSVNFENDTVTFYPKFCNHIKTIPISSLLDKQGHRYCGVCFEKFGIDTYNNISECVKEKECHLVTSKEHFMDLNMGSHSKIKIIGKCTHEYDIRAVDFSFSV